MKKRGQFYLLAALVIVVILFGTVVVTNRSSKKEYSVVYDLSKEVDLEGMLIQEYRVVKQNPLDDQALDDFLERYAQYIDNPDVKMYFIYGNTEKIYIITKTDVGDIRLGDNRISIVSGVTKSALDLSGQDTIRVDFGEGNEKHSKNFDVKEGEYFYYVLTQETEEGEVHIVDSKNEK